MQSGSKFDTPKIFFKGQNLDISLYVHCTVQTVLCGSLDQIPRLFLPRSQTSAKVRTFLSNFTILRFSYGLNTSNQKSHLRTFPS